MPNMPALSDNLARYRQLEREYLILRDKPSADPVAASAAREAKLAQIDEVWNNLSPGERKEAGTAIDTAETEVPTEATAIPKRIIDTKDDEAVMVDCRARYSRVSSRAWKAGAIAVVAFSDLTNRFFLDYDVRPGFKTLGTKATWNPTLRNFIQHATGTLTVRQATDLFNAAFAARSSAPANSIIYAFCFPSDFVLPDGALEGIVGEDGIREGATDA